MRSLLYTLSAMFFSSLVVAQTDSLIGVAGMSPNELDRKLNDTFRGVHGPAVRRQMLADAMATKRIDLIQVCFANPATVLETAQAIRELPDGELKQRATIMMLRTPSSIFWPEERAAVNSNGIVPKVMIEPFISVIPQLLPQVQLTENWLKYQVGRTKLADDMEAALQKRSAQAETPQKQDGGRTNDASEKLPNASAVSMTEEQSLPGRSGAVRWILAGGVLAALAWWLSRKK